MMEKILNDIYYDPSNPAGYGSAKKLYDAASKIDPSITLDNVKDWLSGQLVYTLHKPIRRRWKRNRIVVGHVDEQFQADLVDMKEFSNQNRGHNYILTVIDVLSKYAWAIPVKNKRPISVKEALIKVFEERTPLSLQTDKGLEFNNQVLKKFLRENNIHYFTSKNKEIKCAIVERFNRTLKGKMFKYFTKVGNHRYINILQDLVDSYNNSIHRSIKMRPSEVNTYNEHVAFKNLYGEVEPPLKPKIKIDDKVRLRYELGPFDKSFYPNWTDEVFDVKGINTGSHKPYYILENYNKKRVGRYYPEEVQKIRENLYRVEKILKKKKVNGKTLYFVKWLNYPSEYNSWVENVTSV